jgi:hypothetical protein
MTVDNNNNSIAPQKRTLLGGGLSFATNVAAGLVATGLISLAGVLVIGFSRLNSGSATAFRLLVVASAMSALMATAGFITHLLASSRASAGYRDISDRLALLANHIPAIDWSFDAAEHDRGAYERTRKVIEDPRTLEFRVLTLFRDPKYDEISGIQRGAIRDYCSSLESALETRRGFTYERLIVLRSALTNQRSARELLVSLGSARPDFVEHSRRVMRQTGHAVGTRAEFRFFGDTGRLFDLAFAVALDHQRRPLTLLLEIGVTRPGDGNTSEHPALGLLTLENPSPQLADAFLLAHQALRSGRTSVERIAEETIRDIIGLP